jgi:hypothetical protein
MRIVAGKRRWWIRIPVFLIWVVCLALIALILELAHPILSVGRGLSTFDGEQRATALALVDLTESDAWLVTEENFAIFAGSNGTGPIYLACRQRNDAYLGIISRIARDSGYDAGAGLCDPDEGLVIAPFHGRRSGYYAGRAYAPDNPELCPVFQYGSFDVGSITILWRAGTAIC